MTKARWILILGLIVSIVGFQSERRFDYLISLTSDPAQIEAYQIAYTNFWMLCMAIFLFLLLWCCVLSTKADRGLNALMKFAFGLTINNLLDELFFNPLELDVSEIWAATISAYIAVTDYANFNPLSLILSHIWKHRPSWMSLKRITNP